MGRVFGFSPLLIALFLGSIAAAGAETECIAGENFNDLCRISDISAGGQGVSFMVENLGRAGDVGLFQNDAQEWGLYLQDGSRARLHGNATLFTIEMLQNAILEVKIVAYLHPLLSTSSRSFPSHTGWIPLSNFGHTRTARI
jgi:hypothetical protein